MDDDIITTVRTAEGMVYVGTNTVTAEGEEGENESEENTVPSQGC